MATEPKPPSMQPAPATEQAMPDLPQPMRIEFDRPFGPAQLHYYDAHQMREYGKACRATQAERVQSSGRLSVDELADLDELADEFLAALRKRGGAPDASRIDSVFHDVTLQAAFLIFIDARRATASKAEAPDQLIDSARKLVAGHSRLLRNMYFDGEPCGKTFVAAVEAPAVARNAALRAAPAGQHEASLVLAAELLEQYAAYIRDVKYEDIERHPYLPQVEQTAVELRAIAATTKQGTP